MLLLTFLPSLVSAAPINIPTISVLGSSKSIYGAQFTSDNKFLVTGTSSGTISVWKTSNGQLEKEIKGANTTRIRDLAISPNDRYVASIINNGDLIVWDLQNSKADYTVDLPSSSGGNILYNKDGTIIYVRDFNNKSIYMLNAINGNTIHKISYNDNPTAMAYNPKTNQLAIGFNKGTITIIDATNGNYISTFNQSFPSADKRVANLAYSPTGDELVAIRLYFTSLQFFDVNNNYAYDPVNSDNTDYVVSGSSAGFDSVAISPNNKYIVIFAYGNVRVFDRSTKEMVATASVASSPVNLTISPNGKYIFANRTLFNMEFKKGFK